MIELDQRKAAGFLGTKGVRSWFEFTDGSPRDYKGAQFWLHGPWRKSMGDHCRNGWRLRWPVHKPSWMYCVVVTATFADMMRLAKHGPDEAARRYLLAFDAASKKLGATIVQIGEP